ncbi:MAG: alpha/beta hydrolase fold [Myxococcaceae bacterium]|nr:alpha/beta hydrolase fold [Myxococcaceae bacterium]
MPELEASKLKFAITRDGVRVAYDTVGGGAPLVFVHGLGDERSIWQPVISLLAPHYTCITLDLRGHGQTTGALKFDPFELANDLEAVILEAGLRKPVLIGHSLGAFVATMYAAAARGPVGAVVNVDQLLMLDDWGAIVKPHEAALRAGHVREVSFKVLEPVGLGPLTAAQRARLDASRESLPPEVVLGVWGPFFEAKFDAVLARVERAIERISAPYLSLFGHEAAPAYLTWLRARLRHGQVESWSGLGHFLHLVEPDRFADRIKQFVG